MKSLITKIRLKPAALAAAVFFTAYTAAACGSDSLSLPEKEININVIVKKQDESFWKVVRMGTEAAAKEFCVNVHFNAPINEKDIEEQIRLVNEAIDHHADAIVLAAGDYLNLVDVTEKAVCANIPVIIIDSELNSDKVKSFIATDNVDAGKKVGETLVKKVGDNCTIAVMSFVKGTATAEQREAGFFEAISKYPGIEVISTEYCNSDESTAEQLTETLVEKYPGMETMVCLNAYGTIGTARAIEKLGLGGKIKIIGFDSTSEEVSFVENDIIQALVTQNPFSMGYLGVKYAIDAINNKSVPRYVNTGSTVIDKENMYLPENQKLVFPFTN